jgi:SAM-dependent methyltransferase
VSSRLGFTPEEQVNRNTFTTDAEREKWFRFGLSPREEELVDRYFMGGRRVLDIGCGYGRTTRPLAARGFDVTAIDVVERMIAEGQAVTPEARFCVMSATDLGFADASFDHVLFSANGIDCIVPRRRRDDTLREIHRVLRPGGALVYSSHNWFAFWVTSLWSPSRRADLLRNVARGRIWTGYFRIRQAGGDLVLYYGSPRAEMRRLRAAGFRAVETVPGKLSPRLEPFGSLARRLADAWPYYVARK